MKMDSLSVHVLLRLLCIYLTCLLDVSVSDDCAGSMPTIKPPHLVVEYGGPASAICNAPQPVEVMGWETPVGAKSEDNVQSLVWSVSSVPWYLGAGLRCYTNSDDGTQCPQPLPVTLYKIPDSVRLSLNESDPLTEHRKYTLKCQVESVAPVKSLHVIWYQGDAVVAESTDQSLFSIEGDESQDVNVTVSLTITASRTDHNAMYSCAARLDLNATVESGCNNETCTYTTKAIDDTKSNDMQLEVWYGPEKVIHSPDLRLAVGDTLDLFCHADAKPRATLYSWTHNNVTLPNENSSTLRIESVSMDHAGQYVCSVSNTIDSALATMTVEVYHYLRIVNHSRDESLAAGNMLKLFCHADAKPRSTLYSWTHNNVILLNENSSTLHIESVSMDHAGQYVCSVSNTIDSKQAAMTVEVYHQPRMLNVTGDVTVKAGDKMTLACHANANPAPSYEWRHNGVALANQKSNTLLLDTIEEANGGVYECAATNTQGQDSARMTVTVETKGNTGGIIAGVLICILVVLGIAAGCFWKKYR